MTYIQAHWSTIALLIVNGFYFVLSGVAQSLDAPTAQSTPGYRFWFKMVNYLAINPKRANGLAAIEQSPNFIPAAEAYHQAKLKETKNGPTN